MLLVLNLPLAESGPRNAGASAAAFGVSRAGIARRVQPPRRADLFVLYANRSSVVCDARERRAAAPRNRLILAHVGQHFRRALAISEAILFLRYAADSAALILWPFVLGRRTFRAGMPPRGET